MRRNGAAVFVAALLFLTACSNDTHLFRLPVDSSGVDHSEGISYCDQGTLDETDSDIGVEEIDLPLPDETDEELSADADLIPPENMVFIEATTFMMGCEEGAAPNCTETNATPYHEVSIPGFEIDIYEITKKEYEACVAAGACVNDVGNGVVLYNGYSNENPFCVLHAEHHSDVLPANCINWYGARAYCAWVGKRLPSEAEWELAARGTDGRFFPWGNLPVPSCGNTVMDDGNDWGCSSGLSMPVGSRPNGISPYGLYDMAGNVWEWVEDDWHDDYDAADRPDDGSAWIDYVRPANRVIRGGSFMIAAEDIFEFLTYAHYGSPAEVSTGSSRGFRCAR